MSEKTEMMADMVKNLAALLTERYSNMTMEEALATVLNAFLSSKPSLCICFLGRRIGERQIRMTA